MLALTPSLSAHSPGTTSRHNSVDHSQRSAAGEPRRRRLRRARRIAGVPGSVERNRQRNGRIDDMRHLCAKRTAALERRIAPGSDDYTALPVNVAPRLARCAPASPQERYLSR